MEQKKRQTPVNSIDGFIRPNPKLRQLNRSRLNVGSSQPKVSDTSIVDPNGVKTKPITTPKPPIAGQPEFPKYRSAYQSNQSVEPVKRPKQRRKWSFKRKALTSAMLIMLIGFGIGAWYGSAIIGSLDKAFHGNVFSDVHALVSSTTLKGQNQGRVNILLAGDSADDPGHQGSDLTDSIMILSINTKNHTGFMLSVPRDLWVDIPGWGHEKINAANDIKNFSAPGYPSGGMGQLQQIVQTDLGIPIDYYALIDYSAFKESVDAVGGIKIDIQSPDPRGIYDAYTHLKLPNGEVELNGQEALDLARARGDDVSGDISYGLPNSDFDRTEHQRQMLVALAQKAENIGVLADPIKVSQLFNAFGSNINTNLNLQDMISLMKITKGMDISHLQSLTYSYGGSNSLLTDYTSPDGQESLAPTEGVDNFGQLQQYYQQLTSNNPVVRESPTVVVLNGSTTDNLAHKEATMLSSEGFNVEGVTDAENEYPSSMIVDLTNGQKPASKQLLQTLLPKDTTTATTDTTPAEATEAEGYTSNFVVILGQDSTTVNQP
jgi:LCP family protein required for cell wall assembly